MDGFEASCCDEEVTITVRNSNSGRSKMRKTIEVLGIEKGGGGIVGEERDKGVGGASGQQAGGVDGTNRGELIVFWCE